MATTPSATPTPITPPRVPLTDPRTNLIAREWYLFFLSLFRTSQGADDAFLGPQAQDNSGELASVYDQAQLASMMARYDDCCKTLEQRLDTQPPLPQFDELLKQVEALALAPPTTPHIRRHDYGSFYDTTTQTAAAINTAYAMTLNSTDLSNGVYIGSPTSRVYVSKPGVYNIQFSAQFDNTSGGNHLIHVWLRVDGVDVANSAGQVRLKGTDGELVAAWNYLYLLNAGDYFELMWSVSDTSVQITAQAAAAPVPAIPSVILTVTDNISAYQD
jgi:uncharacterized protein YozE (UPF0346 family)